MERLQERIASLEAAVGHGGIRIMHRTTPATTSSSSGDSKNDPKSPTAASTNDDGGRLPSTAAELNELLQRWKKIEDKTYAQFFKKYDDLSLLLENDVELRTLLLTSDMKEAIISAGVKDANATIRLLDAMKTQAPLLDKQPIDNIGAVFRRVAAAEGRLISTMQQTQSLHGDVDTFIDNYNELIGSVSRKFLIYDSLLSQWETAIDRAIAS